MSEIEDAAVAQHILCDFRKGIHHRSAAALQHLAHCEDTAVDRIEGKRGYHGSDPGREYSELTAEVACPHGHQAQWVYADFGEVADLLGVICDGEPDTGSR